jgi:N-acetylglucosamine-6-sulfatase
VAVGRTRAVALALAALTLAASGAACSTESASRDRAAPPPAVPDASTTAGPQGIGTPASRPAPRPRPAPRGDRRPNLLVITADDMRVDDLRFMPRSRRLLERTGLSFANSFAPNPLCCPARASFLTGRYSHNHRVISHVEPYGFGAFDDSTTLATRLQDAGYRTALVGKYLNGYGRQPTPAGQPSLRYVPPGWTAWRGSTDSAWGNGQLPGHGGTYQYFDTTLNVDGRLVPHRGEYTTDLTARTVQSVVRQFGRGQAKPWFVWWTPVAPHHGGPVEDDDPPITRRTDGTGLRWPTPARPDWIKGRFDEQLTRAPGVPSTGQPEPDISDKPRFMRANPPLEPAELDAITTLTRQRAESLAVLDVRIAQTLARLERSGELERTVVVLTSDNGFFLGEHRRRWGKTNLQESSIRVPLVVSGPGVPHGTRYEPVTVTDLAVTLAATGGTRLPQADGAGIDLTTTRDAGWTRPIVLESLMQVPGYLRPQVDRATFRGLTTSGLRLGRYKLIRYGTGEVEVYDLLADPLELTSVHLDPALTARLTRLWHRYAVCAGDGCRAPLPPDLRMTARDVRDLTRAQLAAEREYYG